MFSSRLSNPVVIGFWPLQLSVCICFHGQALNEKTAKADPKAKKENDSFMLSEGQVVCAYCLNDRITVEQRTEVMRDGVSTLNSSVRACSAQNPQPSSRHHVMFQIETWFQQNKTICYIKLNINMHSVGFIVLFIYNLNFHHV